MIACQQSATRWVTTVGGVQSKRALLGVIAHRTIHDQVYQVLYDAILEGRLESEGLLVRRAQRDTHVVSLNGADVIELYSVRAVLEGYAAVSALATLRAYHLAPMERELEVWDIEHAIREHYLSSAQRLATQVDHGSDQPHGSGKERSPDISIRTISRGAPAPAAHATDTND